MDASAARCSSAPRRRAAWRTRARACARMRPWWRRTAPP